MDLWPGSSDDSPTLVGTDALRLPLPLGHGAARASDTDAFPRTPLADPFGGAFSSSSSPPAQDLRSVVERAEHLVALQSYSEVRALRGCRACVGE